MKAKEPGLDLQSFMTISEDTYKTKNDGHFNFRTIPIRLQFGGNVKVIVEIGFGYKGLANGGIQFNF
jgi:hypothetical protein